VNKGSLIKVILSPRSTCNAICAEKKLVHAFFSRAKKDVLARVRVVGWDYK
jgi:hypothetical protein